MKFTAPRDALLAAYSPAAAVAPSRSPKPILQSVRVDADGDSCVFSATNLELGLRARALGVEVLDPGSAVLPARFGAILRTAPAGCTIVMDALPAAANGRTLHVRAGGSKFELASEDPDLFPAPPEPPAGGSLEVPASDLARMIRRTIFATDEDSIRYALGGTLVERDSEGRLALVGTDGRRLARQTGECRLFGDFPPPPVFPVKAWKILLKHLEDGSNVGLAFGDNLAHVDAGAVKLWTRLVEGRFPRYQDVFPGDPRGALTAEAGPLLAAFKQAEVCTSEESRGVDLALAPGAVSLAAQSADVGAAAVEVPAAYEGPGVTLSLDVRYVVDVLAALDPTLALRIGVIDHKSAAVMRTDDGYAYVIMPLTRDH